MLALQDEMNTRVNNDWRNQGYAWYRAIWTECAELMDHYGWKWWKKQVPDIGQVQLELVDIWHFGLSILLLEHGDPDSAANAIEVEVQSTHQGDDFRADLETFALNTLATKSFDLSGFLVLLAHTGMSFDDLYTQYVGKNVLNFFRQDFGYQEGTYHKQWGGREDNEHLVDIIASLDHSAEQFRDALYAALKKTYLELTAG
ncbi:MAG: dUTP diphosphatase [bacterium]